jgi:hypothetical protein
MRAAFDVMFFRTLLVSYLISIILRDVFVFMTVEALNDNVVFNKSLIFFNLVVDD